MWPAGVCLGPSIAAYQPGQQCWPAECLTVLLWRVGGLCKKGTVHVKVMFSPEVLYLYLKVFSRGHTLWHFLCHSYMVLKWFHNFNKWALHVVNCCSATAAGMINVSTTICLANLPHNSYFMDVCLKMLLPSGFICNMLYYVMSEDLLLLAVHKIFHFQHHAPSAFED